MADHVCPWWGGYFIDNRFRRILHNPETILAPYIRRGMTAMDFGCGMGFFSIPMAKLVGDAGRVICVDLQPQMLSTLRKRAERAGVASRIRTHACEPDRVGVDEPIDFALAFWSAHEAPDLLGLLAEIRSYLVSGGRVLVAEPVGHVRAKAFEATVAAARGSGLDLEQRPPIRLSRAAVFVPRPIQGGP
jgi:ubiquinone/menaquinone biosynthesis C-methylase UbiE